LRLVPFLLQLLPGEMVFFEAELTPQPYAGLIAPGKQAFPMHRTYNTFSLFNFLHFSSPHRLTPWPAGCS
jgi:hypothetical protein